MDTFAALVAIDWADQKHDIALLDTATSRRETHTLKHSAQALDEWATALRARFCGQRVAVILEQSRGPLVFALLKYDFLVLYPINPKTLARFREAFSPSGAKEDPTDADYLLEILLHHREKLTAWLPDDEQTRTLQYLVAYRRRLIGDQTRISNRLTAQLKLYFPQVLDWFDDLATHLVCDFLLEWPTLSAVKKARRRTLEKFFCEHNSVRRETNQRRLAEIKAAVPLTTDCAVINSSMLMVKALAAQMKTVLEAIRELEAEMTRMCNLPQDHLIF